MSTIDACVDCLRRTWLLGELAGGIGLAWRARRPLPDVLAIPDDDLIAAVAGRRADAVRAAHRTFDHKAARTAIAERGLEVVCRHSAAYPADLHDLSSPPAVVHVAGSITRLTEALAGPAVALVGARRASPYGLQVARSLGRDLARAGVTVISGMALGVDAAAHEGALEGGGRTLAVLGGGADVAYPAIKRSLHRRLREHGNVLGELAPGFRVHPWCFPARNRIIAALARLTIAVEAGERSGSLITTGLAQDLGRDVGAVPGQVTSSLAAGTNDLLADGAAVIRGVGDILEVIHGAGACPPSPRLDLLELEPSLRRLLLAVGDGRDSVAALVAGGAGVEEAMAGLAELELRGFVRRGPGGRHVPVAYSR